MYYFYILRCSDNSLYSGITNNLDKRLKEHNSIGTRGAKYTRAKKPVTLVYSEKHISKSSALKREAGVKKWTKLQKEKLIVSG
ncbi:MAG: GIY-YIG nuclease family protein [Microgenomates group bacterium]|nr:GIY-YIG nuclease family protein [Candidatus Woesebacteria bacterium]QQR63823.1 MAG: GIY-YIG nuclease family protein [Candidatus Roizmanbacteria bacterium]